MMWMYIRHGSRSDSKSSIGKVIVYYDFFQIRNPGDDEILDMTSLLPELRDKILAAADVRSLIRN